MKAITIKQPWASLIMTGRKTIETRTWSTKYRGMLLLHSSAKPKSQGPAGVVLGVIKVVDVRRMVKADEGAACCSMYPGAYAWVIRKVAKLATYIPCRGRLGLWEAEISQDLYVIKPLH